MFMNENLSMLSHQLSTYMYYDALLNMTEYFAVELKLVQVVGHDPGIWNCPIREAVHEPLKQWCDVLVTMEIVTTQGNFCNHVCFLCHLQKTVRYTGTVNANIFKGVKFCHLCITQHRHAHTSFMCVWRLDLDEIKYRYMQAYSTCTCIWKHLQLFDLPVP